MATGFGAHAHVLLSPRMMTNAGLGPGDWVALAIRGDTSGGGESATDGCAADDDADAPSAALCSALLARNLPILVTYENARAHENETGSADERARLGRYVVLARAHPHAKASSPNAVALARKTWMSLGRPAGHARIWVCPLDVARAIGAETKETETEETAPAERTDAKALLTETRAFPLAAPSPGARRASAALTLWALEGGAAPGPPARLARARVTRRRGSGGERPRTPRKARTSNLRCWSPWRAARWTGGACFPGTWCACPCWAPARFF